MIETEEDTTKETQAIQVKEKEGNIQQTLVTLTMKSYNFMTMRDKSQSSIKYSFGMRILSNKVQRNMMSFGSFCPNIKQWNGGKWRLKRVRLGEEKGIRRNCLKP